MWAPAASVHVFLVRPEQTSSDQRHEPPASSWRTPPGSSAHRGCRASSPRLPSLCSPGDAAWRRRRDTAVSPSDALQTSPVQDALTCTPCCPALSASPHLHMDKHTTKIYHRWGSEVFKTLVTQRFFTKWTLQPSLFRSDATTSSR